jgi:hypothetical protein
LSIWLLLVVVEAVMVRLVQMLLVEAVPAEY